MRHTSLFSNGKQKSWLILIVDLLMLLIKVNMISICEFSMLYLWIYFLLENNSNICFLKMGKNKKMSEKKKNDEYLKIFMEFDLDSSGGVSKH